MSKRSTALAVSDGRNRRQGAPEKEAEKLPAVETVILPAAMLLAAELVTLKDGPPILTGVHLHRRGDVVRIVATDGERMFVASESVKGPVPAWLDDAGVTLAGEGLKQRITMIAKMEGEPVVTLTFGKGQPTMLLSDSVGAAQFRLDIIADDYIDYEQFLSSASFINLDEDGEKTGREWEPIGIGSSYLKHVGAVADILLKYPREKPAKGDKKPTHGMVIRSYNSGREDAPLVFDFSEWPGAVMVIGTLKLATMRIAPETALLLAPAVRGTVAALRAHGTRWLMRAQDATTEDEKEACLAKAADFQRRVDEVLNRTPNLKAIASEAPEAEPEPDFEDGAAHTPPEDWEPDGQDMGDPEFEDQAEAAE